MTKIPIALSNRVRPSARQPLVLMRNRMVEKNPVLSDDGPSFIARPGLALWTSVGSGPIRALYQQPGAFDDAAFAVSYDKLYKLDRTGAGNTVIYDGVGGAAEGAAVNMTVTGDIGEIGPRLFFADGTGLFVYMNDGFAQNRLQATAIADGNLVVIDGVYYRFSIAGTLDSGTPAGTAGAPWRVLIGASLVASLTNLFRAINATGTAGTDYSTALTAAHATVVATSATTNGLVIRAAAAGAAGSGLVTTETGAGTAWDFGTTQGGGAAGVIQIPVPDEVGVIDVVSINNYVIVIPAQGAGINGRFYWIEPGEVYIDPLNYATAERSADPVNAVRVFNDQFWLMGQNTTEVWYTTGDPDAPMTRLTGFTFDRGVQQGTAVQVKDSVMLVDAFGGVFQIQGGERRVSTPGIEEEISRAIALQNLRRIM